MQVITSLKEWQQLRSQMHSAQIGLVTTMGCLHQGHASLMKKSRQENDISILTIFINPSQFNDPKDYQSYPKTMAEDLQLAEQCQIDYVLVPNETEIYPEGNLIRFITDNPWATILEGQCRPNHFNGVLTVVMKLLNLAQPTRAYFGEKDYQQYQLIHSMVKNYFLPMKIIACPTVREASGLPYSSRNTKLSSAEKKLAEQFAHIFHTVSDIDQMKQNLIALGIAVEYLEDYAERRFIAVKIGPIRLIDNISLQEK